MSQSIQLFYKRAAWENPEKDDAEQSCNRSQCAWNVRGRHHYEKCELYFGCHSK